MTMIASNTRISRDAETMLDREMPVSRVSQAALAGAILFALMGAVFFLTGFTLWSEVFLRFLEFQSYNFHFR